MAGERRQRGAPVSEFFAFNTFPFSIWTKDLLARAGFGSFFFSQILLEFLLHLFCRERRDAREGRDEKVFSTSFHFCYTFRRHNKSERVKEKKCKHQKSFSSSLAKKEAANFYLSEGTVREEVIESSNKLAPSLSSMLHTR